jgi:two-component system sensor histidine kinase RegB
LGDAGLALRDSSIAEWPIKETTGNIAFSWLLRLRWGAVLCQAVLIFIAFLFLEITIPIPIVSVIILFEITSNLYFSSLIQRKNVIPEWLFGLVMFLDVFFLTALIFYTGGPMNPFTFLYLVHIVIGALLMHPQWSWSLAIFTVLCYAALFFVDPVVLCQSVLGQAGGILGLPQNLESCHAEIQELNTLSGSMQLHLRGMLLAFAITAFFIVFFVGRIQKALEDHQRTLDKLEDERARSERLASLATLAAGATHEFSTPLSTIAVAAGEMLHELKDLENNQDLLADAQLIRDQVANCKEILFQMAADAGKHLGEPLVEYTTVEILDRILQSIPAEDHDRILINNEAETLSFLVPIRNLVRSIKGLINNGLDASGAGSPVKVRCYSDKKFLYFDILDQGTGMDQSIIAKAHEPFFTSKEPGKGMGLGLFLAQNVAESYDGELRISSEPGRGTTVTISLALQQTSKAE